MKKSLIPISNTLFFTMCIAFILNIKQTGDLHDGEYTTAANLESAAESLRLRYAVEMQDDDLNDEAASESWKRHERELAGYAAQLQKYRDATRRQGRVLNWTYVGSAVLMVIATLMQSRTKRSSQED